MFLVFIIIILSLISRVCVSMYGFAARVIESLGCTTGYVRVSMHCPLLTQARDS